MENDEFDKPRAMATIAAQREEIKALKGEIQKLKGLATRQKRKIKQAELAIDVLEGQLRGNEAGIYYRPIIIDKH